MEIMASILKIVWIFQMFIVIQQYSAFGFESCPKRNISTLQHPNKGTSGIGLQVTETPLHQLITRIFYYFLTLVLNYRNVYIIPIKNSQNHWSTLDNIRRNQQFPNIGMINLHVLMACSHPIPENVSYAGASVPTGRYSWFVPISESTRRTESLSQNSYSYEIFKNASNIYYDLYVIDDIIGLNISRFDQYKNPSCSEIKCATILAEHKKHSAFIEDQLKETGLLANVLWIGFNFTKTVTWLINEYKIRYPKDSKRIIILHWSPSKIIDNEENFAKIEMPKCEYFGPFHRLNCKYKDTPIVKYYAKSLESVKPLAFAIKKFYLNDSVIDDIRNEFQSDRVDKNNLYNNVACKWLSKHENLYNKWKEAEEKTALSIGGIFPITMTNRGHKDLHKVAEMAAIAINKEHTILPGYNLQILINDGKCQSDMVMKALIHYYAERNILGVLGPACSETVEPLAGIAKHMNMMVISYSVDAAYLANREAYPYFFRTIGSNLLFIDAYLEIMKTFGWSRVAYLTDVTSKFILELETMLQSRNIILLSNQKTPVDTTVFDIKKNLHELKTARSKIIIADLHSQNAVMTFCEAHNLGMTQQDGYIWFLPHLLTKNWNAWQKLVNGSCSARQFQNAIEGHFSLRYTPFGNPNSPMQEGITVQDWKDSYKRKYGGEPSYYAGFTYDAVWTYAKAAHKLLYQNNTILNYLRNPEIVRKLGELISQTNYRGLSGNVSFDHKRLNGSRIINLDFLQWRNNSFNKVGTFEPFFNIIDIHKDTKRGKMVLNLTKIYWVNSRIPEDGRYDCRLSLFARTLHVNCDVTNIFFLILMCLLATASIFFITFCFWKQMYSRKLKRSAQIMKMFGIDLLSPSLNKNNTLDKWEVPKENVVINRRLGEGAFGMVYGGEAQLTSGMWTAVAVKTLKEGQSMEDRLDFLAEAEAMKKFDHRNVIKLLGVCLQSEPIYTIMEFMLYGDLKTYLLARRNMVNEKMPDDCDISSKFLTLYAMDVAKGLAYLAQEKYVHRDIACRNCLVNAYRVVKIADFGMARPTFESDYYKYNRKSVRKLFPVRWMPPETLTLGLFTPASDIWSFGIVVYEVISFGSYPYQGLTNNQVLTYVKNGNAPQIPLGVKPQLKGLLKSCWNQEPTKRPTAREIVEYISNNPRLLTPSLDVPPTAMDMRKCQISQICNELSSISPSTNIREATPISNSEYYPKITPDGYSIMSPLLNSS